MAIKKYNSKRWAKYFSTEKHFQQWNCLQQNNGHLKLKFKNILILREIKKS